MLGQHIKINLLERRKRKLIPLFLRVFSKMAAKSNMVDINKIFEQHWTELSLIM